MRAVLRLRILGVVLAVLVAGLPMAPPEHAHEADDHGHERLLVHRHLDAHSNAHQVDHEGVTNQDDHTILALDAVHAGPSSITILADPATAAVALAQPPAIVLLSNQGNFEPLIHGPPRAPNGTRAPPRLSCL
jgi:Ni/Co efflux regulator RcnB